MKSWLFILVLLVAFALGGCKDDKEYIYLDKSSTTVSAKADSVIVTGESNFRLGEIIEKVGEVSISHPLTLENFYDFKGEWYSICIQNQKMLIKVQTNTSGEDRNLLIIALSGNSQNIFSLIQSKD